MSRAARVSAGIAFAVLTVVGILRSETTEPMQRGTRGTMPWGYRAVYDLLSELGFPVARTTSLPQDASSGGTIWWLQPGPVCGDEAAADAWPGRKWVEAGGTAVVFLPGTAGDRCDVAGLTVPAREESEESKLILSGDVTPGPRTLDRRGLFTFTTPGDWLVRASAGDRPFVLEHGLGKGLVVVVADATFLRNERLDRGDAAPLAVDLVSSYGVPSFAESDLAAIEDRNAIAYLAQSPALGVFVGLALTGLLFAWHGRLLPARTEPDTVAGSPTLDAFVESLAALYAGTRDRGRVLSRYRELTAARLRRHFGVAPETPVPVLIERLRRLPGVPAPALGLLAGDESVGSESELRAAVATLDGLVRNVTA